MRLYHKLYDFDNLYKAYLNARKGKRWKSATNFFEIDAMSRLAYLQKELKEGTYETSEYNIFKVYEPKERTIKSSAFRDKVVQRALCDEILEPVIERSLIIDNFAGRRGKGTHAALKRTEEFYRAAYRKHGTQYYVLKCDIEKYFDSIDHAKLKALMRKFFADGRLLALLDAIIDSTGGTRGVPIGNQSSQWFAITFLNGMDHYIKERLRIKWYVRYMDDFVLIHHDREYLRKCKREIESILGELGLELNGKSHIFPIRNGVDFLGFHTYLTPSGKLIKKVRHDSNKRVKRKLRKFKQLYREGKRTRAQITQVYVTWKAHASYGNTYYLRKEMDKLFYEIFEEDEK